MSMQATRKGAGGVPATAALNDAKAVRPRTVVRS